MSRRVTQLQVYMFFSQFLFSTAIGFFVRPLVRQAGFAVWISVIAGSLIGVLIAYLSYRLCMRRPDRSLAQYGAEILGRWIHVPLILIVIFASLFAAAFILRQLEEFIVQIYLPRTPEAAIGALFGLCIARGVRSGVVTIFRSAQGLFFFSVIAVFTFPLYAAKEMKREMAVALITNFSLPGIWNGSMMTAALFGEMALVAYLFPYFKHPERMKRSLGGAAATAVVITLANVIPILLLFGPELTANLTSPTLELIRYIKAGAFLENLDPLLLVFWLYSMFLKISLFLLVAVKELAGTIKLEDHKPLTYMLAAAMVVLSMYMFESSTQVEQMTNRGETVLLLFLDVVPIVYLLVDWLRSLRRKKGRRQPALITGGGS